MKKFLCLVLAIACVLSLVACGNDTVADKAASGAISAKPVNKEHKADKDVPAETKPANKGDKAEQDTTESTEQPSLPSKVDEKDKDVSDTKEKNDKENKGEKAPTEPKVQESYQFDAKVLEIHESKILVAPVFGSDELIYSDKIYVLTDGIKMPTELQVNDYIRVTYDGMVLESYPVQITEVYEIVKYKDFIEPIDPEFIKPVVTYNTHVVYANWTDSILINAGSICKESAYPVYRLDSNQDIKDFRVKFEHVLSFDAFDELVAGYTDEFFVENSLVLAYVTAGSGSTKYSVYNVEFDETGVNIELTVETPEVGTCDMAGWFVIVELPKAALDGCETYMVYQADFLKKANLGEFSKKPTF